MKVAQRTIVFLIVLTASARILACPFCAKLTRSYSDEIRESEIVVFATLGDPISEPPEGPSTKVVIRTTIKDNSLGDATAIQIPRFVSAARKAPVDRLIFGRIESGQLIPTRLETSSAAFVEYLTNLAKLADDGQQARLRYVFDHLESADEAVARDAYAEFAKASYRSTVAAADAYESDKLRDLLHSETTSPDRVGLYGLLLGLSGDSNDAAYLRCLVRKPAARHLPGLDGILAGFCLLDRERGIDTLVYHLTAHDSTSVQRMSALAALTFLLAESPPENPRQLLARTIPALKYPDVAAPLIDEMRRGECWQAWEEVRKLADSPRDRGAVIRFALACPTDDAAAFADLIRRSDPGAIRDAEQAIDFETDARKAK